MDKSDLGKRIKQEREKLGLTQQQLADACDVGFKHIGSIERGIRTGDIFLINKIAIILNVTIDYLVNGEIPSYVSENIKDIENHVRYFSKEDLDQVVALIKAYNPRFHYKKEN